MMSSNGNPCVVLFLELHRILTFHSFASSCVAWRNLSTMKQQRKSHRLLDRFSLFLRVPGWMCVCVCVCVLTAECRMCKANNILHKQGLNDKAHKTLFLYIPWNPMLNGSIYSWCVRRFKTWGEVCARVPTRKEAARVKLIKIRGIDKIQFVLSVLSECTEDSSRERFHKLQYSVVLILQTQARQDPIFLSLDST